MKTPRGGPPALPLPLRAAFQSDFLFGLGFGLRCLGAIGGCFGGKDRLKGVRMGPLGGILGCLGAVVGASWGVLGCLGASWEHLGASWGHLGASWVCLGHSVGSAGSLGDVSAALGGSR